MATDRPVKVSETGQAPEDAKPDSVIWLVHGTFAGTPSANGKAKAWWEQESAWSRELARRLRELPNGPNAEIRSFQWPDPERGPGPNLETARRDGGASLARLLEEFEEKDRRPYHLIGHSHGGGVIWHALVESARRMRENPNNGFRGLRTWTTIGTPFIEFKTAWSDLRGPLFGLLAAAIVLALWLTTYWSQLPSDHWAEIGQMWNHLPPASDGGPANLWERAVRLLSARTTAQVALFMITVVAVRHVLNRILVGMGVLLSGRNLFRNLASLAFAAFGMSAASTYLLGGAGLTDRRALLVLSALTTVALAILLSWVVYTTWRLLQLSRADRLRTRHEALAAKEYGRKWLGLSHPDDEAIALLSAALLEAPSLRPEQVSGSSRKAPWLEAIARPLFDQATWRTLTQFALGDDRAGLTPARVGRAPHALRNNCRVLDDDVASAMSQSANRAVGEMFEKMRSRLRMFNNVSGRGDFEALVREVFFNGVVHTSYLLEGARASKGSPPAYPLMDYIVQWTARLPERAAANLKLPPLPPIARPGQLRDTELNANPARFARLEGLTASIWVGVVGAAAVASASTVSVAILPYTYATQHHAAESASDTDKLLLNMPDAPVAGAYAVHLAALGGLDDEDKIWRLLRPIAQANTNSVVGQRLAFAFGLTGRDDLVETIRKQAVGGRAHIVRRARIVTLSGLYGKLMAGRPLDERDRVAAREAWLDSRDDRRLTACSDTDQLALMEMYIPLRADGASDFPSLVSELEQEMTYRLKRCIHALPGDEADTSEGHARDLVAHLALASASNVLSWDRPSTARELLRLAVAALPVSNPPGTDADHIRKMFERQELRAEDNCKMGLRKLSMRLGDEDKSGGWSADAVCKNQRTFARTHLGDSCELQKNKVPASNECLAVFSNTLKGLRSVKALCRAERPLLLDGFKDLAERASNDCKAIGDASTAAVRTAFTLSALGEPHDQVARLFALADPPPQLSGKLAAAIPSSAHGRKDMANLAQPLQGLINSIPIGDCLKNRDGKPIPGPRYTTDSCYLSALERDVATVRFLAHAHPDRATEAAQAMFLSLRTEPDRQITREMIILVVDGLMLSPRPEHHELAIDLIDAALGTSSSTRAPVVQYREPAAGQQQAIVQHQIRELLSRRLALDASGAPLDALRQRIDVRLAQEYSEEARSEIIGLLASSHVTAGALHAAREIAARAGERNQLIAIHCRIMGHKLARNSEARRRFGLTPDRRWPQPVPTLFDIASPFTFSRSPPGPLSCASTGNYDID